MRVRARAFAASLAWVVSVVVGPPPARGGDSLYEWDAQAEARALGAASQAFVDAFRAKDEATMDRLATAPRPDPVRVVSALLAAHATGSTADPPEPKDFLAAARDFAARARTNAAADGVAEVVATWEGFTRADFEREERIKAAYRSLARRDGDPAASEADLEKIAAVEEDLRNARASVRAWLFRLERTRAWIELDRPDDALAAAREASSAAERVPWPIGTSRALRVVAFLSLQQGDLAGGAQALARVARIHRGLGDRTTAARAERERSRALRESARYAEAVEAARVAGADARAAGDPADEARARLAEAHAAVRMGGGDATRLATDAAAALGEAGDLEGEAEAWCAVGQFHARNDAFAAALSALERAAATAAKAEDPMVRSSIWTALGAVRRRMRRLDEALEDQRRAVAEAEAAGSPAQIAVARGNLGLVEGDLGRPEYLATLTRALEEKRAVGDRLGATETLLALGAYRARREPPSDETREILAQGIAAARAHGMPARAGDSLVALAFLEERAGRLEAALAAAEEGAAIHDSLGDRGAPAAAALDVVARLRLASGRPLEALAASRRAVDLRRAIVTALGEDDAAALVEIVRGSADVGLAAAARLAASDPRGAAEAAFDVIEGSRATLLATGIVHAESLLAAEAPADVLAAESETRARIEGARRRFVAAAYGAAPDPAVVAAARRRLDEAWADHARAVARLQREAARAAGVALPSPVRLQEHAASLGADAAYVAYQVTEESLFAVVATRDSAALRSLGPSADLPARVEAYLRVVSTPGADDAPAATALYDLLLRPLEGDLGKRRRWVVAPDGPLAFLPLEALVRADVGRRERVVERATVSYVPSATVLRALREESGRAGVGRGFLGLGDPDYAGATGTAPGALVPLPASGAEVRAIAELYPAETRRVLLGRDASRDALLRALPAKGARLRALHVATHAFVDPERPRLSCLVLAGGEVLDLDAVHRLRVPADLAVLSACSTARGALLRGEGVLGFARAFFFAGVPRVVVSDWVVSDDASSALLRAFHARHARGGVGAADALRDAKVAALRDGGPGAHPSAWAAFVLWGLPD